MKAMKNVKSSNEQVDELVETFEYLDGLRQSGVVNMFSAGKYLVQDLGLDRKDAHYQLGQWMRTFSSDESAKSRASKCAKKAA